MAVSGESDGIRLAREDKVSVWQAQHLASEDNDDASRDAQDDVSGSMLKVQKADNGPRLSIRVHKGPRESVQVHV